MRKFKPVRDMDKDDLLEQIYKAREDGYIQRCGKCGSFRIHIYTDEDYFTNMTRCLCVDCKNKFGYGD